MTSKKGSATEDATTYGMPRREALSRGKQHLHLLSKAMEAEEKARKNFEKNPSISGLAKVRKQSKRTSAIAKSTDKISKRLSATKPRPYGSQKGFN